jgi:hypothetical protein
MPGGIVCLLDPVLDREWLPGSREPLRPPCRAVLPGIALL